MMRCIARTAVAACLGVVASASPAIAQSPAADSARAIALFRESAAAGLEIPSSSSHRIELLLRIARRQASAGDRDGALGTGSALGPWRREVQTDLACRLSQPRRIDDAVAFVSSLPPSDRDWARAHLASQAARAPMLPQRQRPDTVDTRALARRALRIARDVRSPHARVDALISIGYTQLWQHDSSGAVATFRQANATLRGVRDSDVVTTRREMIGVGLRSAGHIRESIVILRTLPTSRRLRTAWGIGEWHVRREPLLRTELRALVPLLASVVDTTARAEHATHLAESLRAVGDSAAAGLVVARYPPNDTAAAPATAADVVESLARDGDIVGAFDAVARISDPARVGFQARAYLDMADAMRSPNLDTIRLVLSRASSIARASSLGDTLRSRLLVKIASTQLTRGFHDDGLSTVSAIPVPVAAAEALLNVGRSASLAERSRVIDRAPSAEVRTLATAWLAQRIVSGRMQTTVPDDVAWAIAVADSFPAGEAREQTQIAVALHALARKDTVAARARLLPLLATHDVNRAPDLYEHDGSDGLPALLVRLGATDDVLRWARSLPDPSARAAALLAIGHAIIRRTGATGPFGLGNGPDMCREVF